MRINEVQGVLAMSVKSQSTTVDRMLFQLHYMLDSAAHDGGKVPVGASAMLGRAIDEMRAAALPIEEIRRAETVAVSLHCLEWIAQADSEETLPALERVRDEVRLLLISPADAALPENTRADTLFDWPKTRTRPTILNPSVWLNRLRHRQRRALAA